MKSRGRSITVMLSFLSILALAQIPDNPNKTDPQNRRQGSWTILYDKAGSRTQEVSEMEVYRLFNYQDDKPVGVVTEYFKNGKIKSTFQLLQDRPKSVRTGKTTIYNHDGIKEYEAEFENGNRIGQPTLYYVDGSIIKDSIHTLNAKSVELIKAGEFLNALPWAEKTHIMARYGFSKKSEEFHVITNNLIGVYVGLNKLKEAEDLLLILLEVDEQNVTDSPFYTSTLKDLITVSTLMHNYQQALDLSNKLKLYIKVTKGEDHPDYMVALTELATAYSNLEDYKAALPLLETVERAQRTSLGMKSKDYRGIVSLLVTSYEKTNQYGKAIATQQNLMEHSLDFITNTDLANGYVKLAMLRNIMGQYVSSEILLKAAIELREKKISKDDAGYAIALGNLALVYANMRNFAGAEPLYKQSIAILKKKLEGNEDSYNEILTHQANFYNYLGNYPKAEEVYQEVLLSIERISGKENKDYIKALNPLGVLYTNQGNYAKAELVLSEEKDIQLRMFGKKNEQYAIILNNLALVYTNTGDNKKAIQFLTEAVDIQSSISGKETIAYATTILNLAERYKSIGVYALAEKYLEEANEIIKTIYGKSSPERVMVMNNLASFYKFMNKFGKAEPMFIELMNLKVNQIQRDFPSLSEKEKQLYYSKNQTYITNFENFCVDRYAQNPSISSNLFNARLYTKGLLFNESNKVRQRILNSSDSVLIKQFNLWQQKKDSLAKLYKMTFNEKQELNLDEKLMEEQTNALEKALSLKSGLMEKLIVKKTITWQDVASRLLPGEAAIEMVQTLKAIDSQFELVYAALVVTAQTRNHPEMIVLENGAELEGKYAKYYRNAIKQQLPDDVSYNQFWKPIGDKLKGVHKIYFSADGVYNQINLNTLSNPSTGKNLIDELDVQMVTSLRDVIETRKVADNNIKNATLFGFPNYNNTTGNKIDDAGGMPIAPINANAIKSDSAQRFFNGDRITELPGTKLEIETIENLLLSKNIALKKYMFDDATEAQIKKLVNPQVLHIATHGYFLSDLPKEEEGRGFGGMESQKINENPLLRSGLLFAGSRRAFDPDQMKSGEEDGILTAFEAMSLNLGQTDLVVMSACETGLGVTANGEGVYGLQRAFHMAGAKTILMSLWAVSDEATQQLMTMFYENWLAGKSTRDAFRSAQFALRTKFPQPFYWGAFVLVEN